MWEYVIQYAIANPQAGVLTVIGAYLAYEIRHGMIADLRERVTGLSNRLEGATVILYRLAKESNETDARAVRDVLWDNGRSFPDDFDSEGRYVGQYLNEDGEYVGPHPSHWDNTDQ